MRIFETTPVVILCIISYLFKYCPAICSQELQPSDYSCLIKDKVSSDTIEEQLSLSEEERKQQCYVNCSYTKLDVFGCNENECNVSIKRKCLMCGLPVEITKNRHLCRNLRDEPQRYLKCNECLEVNPCINNGTAVCPSEEAYGWEMTCQCQPGYTGRFCEEKMFVCNYSCGEQKSSTIPNYDENNDTECSELLDGDFNCSFQNQYPKGLASDVTHFCDNLPRWEYGSWSQCSQSCDEGYSYRRVSCVRNVGNDTYAEFNHSDCRHLKQLETVQNCVIMKCPVDIDFHQLKPFSPTIILAGMNAHILKNTTLIIECRTKMKYKNRIRWLKDGVRVKNDRSSNIRISRKKKIRILYDITNDKFTVYTCRVGNFSIDSKVYRITQVNRNVSYSIKTNKQTKDPSDNKRRHLHVTLKPWTHCIQLCGFGIQTRDFKCEIITDNYIQEFPKEYCPYKEMNITLNRTCYIQSWVKWKYTPWTPCTKTCDGGVMQRSASCVRLLQSNSTYVPTATIDCDNLTRDSVNKTCNLYNCSVREIVKKDLEFFQMDTVPKVYLYIGMNASVLTNSKLVINCRTRGIDIKKIRWFKNGKSVLSSRNLRISKKCRLRIKSVSSANEGKYCCRYQSHKACLYLKVHTLSRAEEVKNVRQTYKYHDTSRQLTKDPFDRVKRPLNIRLSNWSTCSTSCGYGIQERKILACEIITKYYTEAFETKFCLENYFSEELELIRRCKNFPCYDLL